MTKGEQLIEIMKNKGGYMTYYGVKAIKYVSGIDDKGVIRDEGYFLDENGQKINKDSSIDFLESKKFFNKDNIEIDEPRIVLPCNVIYGP